MKGPDPLYCLSRFDNKTVLVFVSAKISVFGSGPCFQGIITVIFVSVPVSIQVNRFFFLTKPNEKIHLGVFNQLSSIGKGIIEFLPRQVCKLFHKKMIKNVKAHIIKKASTTPIVIRTICRTSRTADKWYEPQIRKRDDSGFFIYFFAKGKRARRRMAVTCRKNEDILQFRETTCGLTLRKEQQVAFIKRHRFIYEVYIITCSHSGLV
jgi:hypothetical protein